MTTRESVISVMDSMDEERLLKLLAVAESLAEARHTQASNLTLDTSPDIGDVDPLVALIGIGRSDEPTDIATRKDEYLAEAFGSSA